MGDNTGRLAEIKWGNHDVLQGVPKSTSSLSAWPNWLSQNKLQTFDDTLLQKTIKTFLYKLHSWATTAALSSAPNLELQAYETLLTP